MRSIGWNINHTQERERAERERVVRQKVAASTFARGYLSGIVNSVFGKLQDSGFFYDPLLREVGTILPRGNSYYY